MNSPSSRIKPEPPHHDDRRRDRRKEDRKRTRWTRFWMLIITVLWLWLALTVRHQNTVRDRDRKDGTHQRCELTQTIIDTAVDLGVPPRSPKINRLRILLVQCKKLEAKSPS